jgi:hypothetical protein
MDELERLVSELPSLIATRRAEGIDITDADIDAYVREETKGRFGWDDVKRKLSAPSARSFGRSVAQGLTFNFADEIVGALAGKEARDEMRMRENLYAEENPGLNLVGQLAGGVLLPGLVAGKTAATLGTSAGRAVGVGAATGALAGAAAGAGAGETGSERLTGAAVGGGLGGVLGAAVPAAVSGLKSVFSAKTVANKIANDLIEKAGGADKLRQELARYRAAGLGDEAMLGDLTAELRGQTQLSAATSLDVNTELRKILELRKKGAPVRTMERARRDLPTEDATVRRDALAAERRAWADSPDGFQGLREANPSVSLGPQSQGLWNALRKPGARELLERSFATNELGVTPNRTLSFQVVQDVKEQLDDEISAAFRAGHGNRGKRLAELRDVIVKEMEQNFDGYAKTSRIYRDYIAREEAISIGQGLWRAKKIAPMQAVFKRLEGPYRDEARIGLASEFLGWLEGPAAGAARNLSGTIDDASMKLGAKLKLAFGSRAKFERFIRENRMEARLAEMQVPPAVGPLNAASGSNALSELTGAVGSAPVRAARFAARAVGQDVAGAANRQIGQMMLLRGGDSIEKLLAQLRMRQPAVPPWMVGGAAAAAPAGAGLLR